MNTSRPSIVCVQPAPGKLWYAVLPAALSLPGLPRPQQAPAQVCFLRSRYIIFKYQKWWLDCSCQISNSFQPRGQIRQTPLCSRLTRRCPAPRPAQSLGFCLSLLTFRISADLSFFSTVASVSSLFTCDCSQRLSSILPLFLPPSFLPFLNMLGWSHHSQCFNSMDMLMSTIYNYSPYFSEIPCLCIQLPLWCS